LALAGIALAIHFATWIASLEFTSVAVSTLVVTTTPIWTEAYDALRARRPPGRAYVLALTAALAGVALIAFAKGAQPAPVPGHELLGDGLALCGSLAIGAYLLIVRDAGKDGAARLATRAIVLRTYGWATLGLVLAASFAREGPPPLADTTAWAGILAMAFVSQLLGHTALNAALRDFRPSIVAFSTLAEPVVAALLAALVFREFLGAATIGGGVLVLVAIGVALAASAETAL
jgi:drug/metabolite transporter (DMT)-like permease